MAPLSNRPPKSMYTKITWYNVFYENFRSLACQALLPGAARTPGAAQIVGLTGVARQALLPGAARTPGPHKSWG